MNLLSLLRPVASPPEREITVWHLPLEEVIGAALEHTKKYVQTQGVPTGYRSGPRLQGKQSYSFFLADRSGHGISCVGNAVSQSELQRIQGLIDVAQESETPLTVFAEVTGKKGNNVPYELTVIEITPPHR
ncbi:MAG: hypothetical protein V1735_02460 [Nanoarchaeota archaeon]